MRTFSRSDWLAAQAAWDEGDFGYRWQALRRIAAERGYIYPPSGAVDDDREVESPSQRAIVWRALEDNPSRLEAIVRRSRSWSQVVDGIIGLEERLRQDADEDERVDAWQRRDDPTHLEVVASLGSIMTRLRDSLQ